MSSSRSRREFWERVVTEQRASGLTGRAWCEGNGVAPAAFYLWRKKLSADAPSPVAARRPTDIQWLPVQPAGPILSSASPRPASSGVTLRVGAVSVEIASGFDTRALSDVLTILESRC